LENRKDNFEVTSSKKIVSNFTKDQIAKIKRIFGLKESCTYAQL